MLKTIAWYQQASHINNALKPCLKQLNNKEKCVGVSATSDEDILVVSDRGGVSKLG